MMAEDVNKPTNENNQSNNDPQGQNEPDYKALYEAEKANSKKWEERAKSANSKALNKANAEKATVEEQLAEIEKKLQEANNRIAVFEDATKYDGIVAEVVKETGLSTDLVKSLKGSTKEELIASADILKKQSSVYPLTRDNGEQGKHNVDTAQQFADFLDKMF